MPESDGSPGQDAIRQTLEHLLPYGARYAEQIDLASTHLLRRIDTPSGTLEIYVATWGTEGLCYGYVPRGFDLGEIRTIGCPENEPFAEQPPRLDSDWIESYELAPGIWVIDGTPPVGTARLTVRFEDGTTFPADIVRASFFALWLGQDRLAAGRRPVELRAENEAGAPIGVLALDPNEFGR